MLYIHRYKIIALLLFAFSCNDVFAQKLNPLYDRQTWRFGFGLMGNTAKLKYTTNQNILSADTLQKLEAVRYPGFGLGGLLNYRINKSMDARVQVNINFANRDMNYYFRQDLVKKAEIESTYMEIPLALEYKSKRHKNARLYVLGGITYRFDFTSDAETDRSNTKPIVALYPNTLSYDMGVGMDFYFQFFKFSPEIKLSNGLGNQLVPDGFIYASSIDRLSPKILQFSLIFQ